MSGVIFKHPSRESINNAVDEALNAVKEQILTDCNYYCRQDQGTLIDSSRAVVSGQEIKVTWNTAYARRVYYTGTPSKNVNPNASLLWAEKAASKYRSDWADIISKGLERTL